MMVKFSDYSIKYEKFSIKIKDMLYINLCLLKIKIKFY